MSERRWTKAQEHGFTVHGGSLLISAAAGSGKTAVLVERIIRMIVGSNAEDIDADANLVDVNRLLVVTFTRAAAAEMRQRLSNTLTALMAKNPHNERYQQQQLLLPQASITTVDGFCSQILRRYAAYAGLPPKFRIAEESETALLSAQALDEVLEESYRLRAPGFMALADTLNGLKNDAGIRDRVLKAYTFMQAQPFPRRWLREQTDAYVTVLPLEQTAWMQPLIQEVNFTLDMVIARAKAMLQYAVEAHLDGYSETLQLDVTMLEDVRERFHAGSFDEKQAAIAAFKWETLKRNAGAEDEAMAEAAETVKNSRKSYKDAFHKLTEYFYADEATVREELAALAPAVEALGELVLRYSDRYDALKRERKLVDFNDIEHACVRLLVDEQTNERTLLAKELSEQFEEIMVDECQDINAVQDTLFRALSKDEKNLFMVGDVKQSIYGFRQAMPEIFIHRMSRERCTPYDEDSPVFPASIILGNNFRSRLEVTDTVNFLFRQLMQQPLGGVPYDEDAALVCSADYPAADGCETEWLLVDKAADTEKTVSTEIAEARIIAQRIQEQMMTMTVWDKDKKCLRPLEYRDICILLRVRKHIQTYIKELTRLGIPVGSEGNGSLLATPEVATVLSLLRCVDNPLREVDLTAVMMSPLFGFTADDCARLQILRRKQNNLSLYATLERVDSGAWEAPPSLTALCRHLMSQLRHYRVLAASLSADRLLERLYRDSGIVEVFSARVGGRQRVANLQKLDAVARRFEQDGFRGLSAFVRYLDRLQEHDKKLDTGNSLGGDGVRVMTMHGSKGLEFPVVYLARVGGRFYDGDSSQKLLFHHTVGIGLCLRDEVTKSKDRTLPYYGVKHAIEQDEVAEELRVWYVAMTRAREKLCIVASDSNMTSLLEKTANRTMSKSQVLPYYLVHAQSPAEWFLTAALKHRSFVEAGLRSGNVPTETTKAETDWVVTMYTPPSEDEVLAADNEAMPMADAALVERLRERLVAYPYAALKDVPAKTAASHLSHKAMQYDFIAQSRPAFMQGEGLTAAQKGTALHTFMQHADYENAAADAQAERQRLQDKGFLTEQQAAALPLDRIKKFFDSDLCARMRASADFRREFPFTVLLSVDEVIGQSTGFAEETVVVQGIADGMFREGDGWVLVDYKTDHVKTAEELVSRYRKQLQCYKTALEEVTGLPVTEAVLYSFYLNDTISVDL